MIWHAEATYQRHPGVHRIGMKVDVEVFELEVLCGCEQALSEHPLKLVQLEWNAASTTATGPIIGRSRTCRPGIVMASTGPMIAAHSCRSPI